MNCKINQLDSLKITFKLENLKQENILALKDNSNNKYNPKTDKIGFIKELITIPNDTVYELELFKKNFRLKPLNRLKHLEIVC
jgi:hypothetical protein